MVRMPLLGSTRLPRFRRAPTKISSIRLTLRDSEIIRHVARHRFLRSPHIAALTGDPPQQVLRRLQRLFHHGYLDRPRAQLTYFHEGGSQAIVYGLGNRGAEALSLDDEQSHPKVDWTVKNRDAKALYLRHTLAVADVMVAIELACRNRPDLRLIREEELAAAIALSEPFRWSVSANGQRLGLVPDKVFALERTDSERSYFFLEADRGTMPVARASLSQTSFFRKLVAYEATWSQGVHRSRFGFHRFRVLTMANSSRRVENLIAACRKLPRGHGLFLFTDARALSHSDPLDLRWQTTIEGETDTLL